MTQIHESFYEVSNKTKEVERRLNTLAQHLAQCDILKKHKAVYDKYKQLSPKKQEAFYDKHIEEIYSYKTAKKYLDEVMNGRTPIPIKSWKAEQEKLIAVKYTLSEKYYSLKDEIRNIELLWRGVENLIREESQRELPERARGISR